MTFKDFQGYVKRFRPELEVTPHGRFGPDNKHGLCVSFPNGKDYIYTGDYCTILRKLRIPTVYKKDVDSKKAYLAELEAENGTEDEFFGGIIDNTDSIAEYKAEIENYEKNYIMI